MSQTRGNERFADRYAAGRLLGQALQRYRGEADVLVLALPRGGVPVAYEVAQALQAPLDVFLVRKLGVPGHEELALGAIASGGIQVFNDEVIRELGISATTIRQVAESEGQELQRRERRYRGGRPAPPVTGRVVILIDDGLATGATMRAAVAALRQERPRRLVVAVPVAAASSCADVRREADEVVCLRTPDPFQAVGLWYDDFDQISDEEVHALLDTASAPQPPRPPQQSPSSGPVDVWPVRINAGAAELAGDLTLPAQPAGLVIFAHGSGSGRLSPRNRYVASELVAAGLGTLLVDLLSEAEEQRERWDGHLRFNIPFLAERLTHAAAWARRDRRTGGLAVGYFGASTGAGAALLATAEQPRDIAAVVSRGGRPDLAGEALRQVHVPTLLIVGGEDSEVITLNQQALRQLSGPKRLEIVPGAGHLFEEPGTLEQVARLARGWFLHALAERPR